MGLEHWLFGAGAGSVVMLYQQYRPDWAAREAEILFQLHSTPVHLWAELGLGGVITVLCLLVAIASFWIKLHRSQSWQRQPQHQAIAYALFGSLLGYGILAITDYQLDVPAIAGGLVVILAMLAYLGQIHTGDWVALGNQKQPRFWLAMLATIYLLGAIAWLVPVNRAWQSSSVGFIYLARAKNLLAVTTPAELATAVPEINDLVNQFQDRLKLAHQLAPWEPYYPYQLGWNLADLALSTSNLKELPTQAWQQEGLNWLKTAIAVNPHNEAMYNAAAWLSYQQGLFADAETYFRQGLQLHPLKRSLSFGLGLSLLRQNKLDLAIAAMVNEVIHDPIFITSPIWNNPSLQPLYPQIVTQVESNYSATLSQAPANPSALLKLASLHWWIGKPDAMNELERSGGNAKLLADAIKNDLQALSSVLQNPQTALELVIAAWLNPDQRPQLLERAYVFATREPLLENDGMAMAIIKAMGDRMGQVPNFDQWLRSPVPANSPLVLNYRRARVGFGVVSRHIDGVIPVDFFNVSDRAEISLFLRDLFPIL
jgi:tetratricopeptide (TPR) repeat protein